VMAIWPLLLAAAPASGPATGPATSPAIVPPVVPVQGKLGTPIKLFNGKDLSGWSQVNCAPETFTVKDGEIVCTGIPNGVLRAYPISISSRSSQPAIAVAARYHHRNFREIATPITGASLDAPSGYYLNPAAYAAPASGEWGNAGRNSATGPAQFVFNANIARTFQWTERVSFDWRIDATNLLNRETYVGVNSTVGSALFGLPSLTNTPRRIQSTMRLRF